MRRLVALVVAAAMVGGAFVVRDRLQDDDSSAAAAGGGGGRDTVLCAAELESICREVAGGDVEVVVEPAATSMERLQRAEPDDVDEDAWVAPAPWAALLGEARQRAGLAPLLGNAGTPIARSPLVMAAWRDRAAALEPRCAGKVTWKCVGEAAGVVGGWKALGGDERWGRFKPGHADPTQSAVGAAVLGQASASFFGRADLSAADLSDDAFLSWFGALERAVPTFDPAAGSAFEQMLFEGPSAFDVAGTIEAVARPLLDGAPARATRLTLLYPDPVATLDVLVTPVLDHDAASSVLARFRSADAAQAFARAGWRAGSRPAPAGAPALAPGGNLPSPGLLAALAALWRETVR